MRPNVRQVGGGGGPEEWFKSLPIITRCYLVAAMLSTLLSHFGIISARYLIWNLELVKRFEFWRLVTPFVFFGGLGVPFVMQLFILVQYSTRYEKNPFNTGAGGGTADYAFMLIFGMVTLLLINIYLEAMVLGQALVYMIMYVWSCREPTSMVNFWGFQFQAMYMPWAMAGFQFLMSGNEGLIVPGLGIAVGHLFYFLIETVPTEYGHDFLKTPNFLIDLFGLAYTPGIEVTRAPGPGGRPTPGTGGYQWGGSGRVLGSTD